MGLVFYFLALVNNINVRAAVSGAAHNTELLASKKESKKKTVREGFLKSYLYRRVVCVRV